jgi:hypothetical protein
MTHRPPGTFLPPTADHHAADQDRRLHALEQRPQEGTQADRHCITASTCFPPVAAFLTTNPVAPWWGAITVHMVIVHVTGINDTDLVTVELRRNGATVVSMPDLALGRHQRGVNERWAIGDTLDLTLSGTAGRVTVEVFTTGDTDRGVVFAVDPDEDPGG